MAAISISDLRPTGASFFMDSESFMDALDANEVSSIQGGFTPVTITSTSSPACLATVGTAYYAGAAVVGGAVGWWVHRN